MLNALAHALAHTALYGSCAAVLVWLGCLLLRRLKAPRALCSRLWLMVLFCLLCPAGIPVTVAAPAPATPAAAVLGAVQLAQTFAAAPAPSPAAPATPYAAPAPALPLWVWVWLGGVCLLGLRAFWQAFRLRRRVALAYKATTLYGAPYYTGSCVPAPFTAGLLQPRIYLPRGLSPAQQRHILLHEQAHIARGDHRLKPLFFGAVCLHWYNPLVWLAYRQFCLDTEAACDEAVLCRLADGERTAYCESLVQFARLRPPPGALTAFGESSITARIRAILSWKRPGTLLVLAGAAVAVCVGGVCLLRPAFVQTPPQSSTSQPAQSAPADTTLPVGSFRMEHSAADTADPSLSLPCAPTLTLQADGSFHFQYDMLSSYANYGRASRSGDTLTCTTDDGRYTYLFTLLPDGSLAFAAAGSADTTTTDNHTAVPDGAHFVADTAAPPTVTTPAFTPTGSVTLYWPLAEGSGTLTAQPGANHTGVDLAAETGTPIFAAADGIVLQAGYDPDGLPEGCGNAVWLAHANGFATLYAHCDSLLVQPGDTVTAGQQIAAIGSTGRSSGPHLHFELQQTLDGQLQPMTEPSLYTLLEADGQLTFGIHQPSVYQPAP